MFEKANTDLEKNHCFRLSHETVNLPHTWNTGDNNDRGRYVYQRSFSIGSQHTDQEIYIEFLGANSVCQVYLNSTYLGEHRGGYATFRFLITQLVRWEEDNELTVYVDNSPTEDVSPLAGDFTIYGGLYRGVNLICTDQNHFDLGYYGTSGVILRSDVDEEENGVLNLELHTKCSEGVRVQLSILDEHHEILETKFEDASVKNITMKVERPVLWQGKENPCLYTLKAELVGVDTVYDEVSLKFGFRSCSLHAEQGFYLNGKHLRINGVAKHQDCEGYGNAVTPEVIRRDFDLIGEIGANAVRLSHYQHDQLVYDLCDQEGYVVWAEIPMMSMPDSESVLKNAEEQLKELVLQNCHHPSICFWGVQNEIAMGGESISMYRSVDELNDTVHKLLPKALTASANMYYVKNASQLNQITDMIGYNLYYGWYYGETKDLDPWIEAFHQENPEAPLGISEYGADANLAFHSAHPKVKDYSEEFQSVYHEETYSIISAKPYLWGSFLWNMFDFGSAIRNEGGTKGKNCKGLVTFDRKVRKDAFYFYKANWSKEPFIHICEKRFIHRHEDLMDIKVYSNLSRITLSVNGVEMEPVSGKFVFLIKNVALKPGQNIIRAHQEEVEDQAVFMKVDEPDLSYVFVDPHPEINVKNWFTQEQGEVDVFPENFYSILDSLDTLMASEAAWNVVKKFAPKLAERAVPGAVTLLWVCNKMKSVLSEEMVKEMNGELIKIPKGDMIQPSNDENITLNERAGEK